MARAARLAAPDALLPPQEWTPWHCASGNGNVEAVKALVGLGAAVDARNVSEGEGPGTDPGMGVERERARRCKAFWPRAVVAAEGGGVVISGWCRAWM